jgi:hypothetical protein
MGDDPPPMRPAFCHVPIILRAGCVCSLGGALIAMGCQPVQVIHPPGTMAPLAPQPLFAAPPAGSTAGVVIDPFAHDPTAAPYTESPVTDFGAGGPNQIHVPVANRDWAWEQIVDVVDDYFRIERERQVQLVGDVLTEGSIETWPTIGATILEPHRGDSVGRYNRWESTLQTIRRRATVRVIPDAQGYLIDVQVDKELEDLPSPERSTAGAAVFRNDSSLAGRTETVGPGMLAGHWILLGRDPALEQRMLSEIQARLSVQPASVAGQ